MLQDKSYIGYSVQGKSSSFDHKRHKQIKIPKDQYIEVPDCHEKIVPVELFEEVQKKRSQRLRCTKTGEVHKFATLVHCGNCKGTMRKSGSSTYDYLVCRTYKDFGKEYCSPRNSIRYDKLENYVLKAIQLQITFVLDLQQLIEKINLNEAVCNKSSRIEKALEDNEKEIEKEEYHLDLSYYDWKNGDISKEQYKRLRYACEDRVKQLSEVSVNLKNQKRKLEEGLQSNDDYFKKFVKYKNITELNREILKDLIENIYVYPDGRIEINFNYKDQYELILDFIEANCTDTKEKQKILKKDL